MPLLPLLLLPEMLLVALLRVALLLAAAAGPDAVRVPLALFGLSLLLWSSSSCVR